MRNQHVCSSMLIVITACGAVRGAPDAGVEIDGAIVDPTPDAAPPDAAGPRFGMNCAIQCPGGAVLIDDSFEDGDAACWTLVGSPTTSVACEGDSPDGDCHFSTSSGGVSAYRTFAAQRDVVLLRAWIHATGGGSGPGGFVLRMSAVTGEPIAFVLSPPGPSQAMAVEGSSIGSLPSAEWHCVKALVDLDARTIDVQIDDGPIVTDRPFDSTTPTSVTSFELINNNLSVLRWDAVRVLGCPAGTDVD